MNALLHWLNAPEWSQVVKTLLHSLWQGALITMALVPTMRRLASPYARYRCSLVTLAAIPVAGIITWAILNSFNHPPPLAPLPIATEAATPFDLIPLNQNPVTKLTVFAVHTPAPPQSRWTAWLALAWLVGAVSMVGRAGAKVAGAERLRRACQPLDHPQITQLVTEARRAVGLVRKIRVAFTDKLTSPAVVGVLVPTLILPLSLVTTLTPEQIRFILLHELAHIRRGDYFANLFQLFVEALLFFNPAVWWISHQVHREREACCDALAIELSGAPADYARTLVHVAESILSPTPASATAFGGDREPSSLADRIQRLLVPGYHPSLRLKWRAMIGAFVLGATLLVLSAEGTRVAVEQIAKSTGETKQSTASPQSKEALPVESLTELSNHFANEFSLGESNAPGYVGPKIPAKLSGSPELERVKRNLKDLRFKFVSCSNKPLAEFFRELAEESQSIDPEGNGFRFSILPIRFNSSAATINPPLTNANLLEILAAIQGIPRLELAGINANGRVTLSPGVPSVTLDDGASPSKLEADQQKPHESDNRSTQTNLPNLEITALNGTGQVDYNLADGKVVITNGGVVRSGDTTIGADSIQLDQKTGILVATGNVRLEGPEFTNNSAHIEVNIYSNSPSLLVRTYMVDPILIKRGMESASPASTAQTNVHEAVRNYFATLGVDLNPPKSVFFNDRKGEVVFRANKKELDIIESILQALNRPIPQVNVKARFVKIDDDQGDFGAQLRQVICLTNVPPGATDSTGFTGILTDPQFRLLLRDINQRKGVDLLGEGEVATLSGRQAQIQVVELRTVVNGFELVHGGLESLRKQAKEQDVAIEKAKVDLAELRSKLQISNLDAGFTAPQPLMGMEEYKRYVATRFEREVVYKGRLEQFQKLNALSRKELRDVLPGMEPDPTLSDLIDEHNAADQKIKSLGQGVSKTHPEYVRLETQCKRLNEKIDARVDGIMKLLKTQLTMMKSECDSLVESVETARRLDQEKPVKYRPYYDQKRALEDMINSRRLLTRKMDLEEIYHLPPSVPNPSLPGNTETNLANTNLFHAQILPFIPAIDVIPTVVADGHTIQMTVIPTLTEFLGYDDPRKAPPGAPRSNDETLPLPRVRVRQVTTSAVVGDGQTLVLGVNNGRLVPKQPGGRIQKEKNPDTNSKQLLIFITLTIVDPAGNRTITPATNKGGADESFQTSSNLFPIFDKQILY